MVKFRKLLALNCMLLVTTLMCRAGMVDGVIVTTADAKKEIPVSSVSKITFGDEGMTVTLTDATTMSFSGDWQMTFGQIDLSAIESVEAQAADGPARVYTIDGRLIVTAPSGSQLPLADLPAGVYVIEINGSTFKVQR